MESKTQIAGIDLDAIKATLAGLQNKNSKKNYLWRPEDDSSTTIRLLPYKHNPSMPFTELKFHYGKAKGNQYFLSPATYGKADPFVEAADELASAGDKENWKLSRKLMPTQRTYVPVVVRGEENAGVKMWGIGSTVYEELLKLISDPDYGDITHTETGTDIVVEKQSGSTVGNIYGKISVRPKRKSSILTNDPKLLEKLLDEQPDLTEIYPETSYEKLTEVLEAYLNPDSDDEKTAADTSTEASIKAAPAFDKEKIFSEFDEMMKAEKK